MGRNQEGTPSYAFVIRHDTLSLESDVHPGLANREGHLRRI